MGRSSRGSPVLICPKFTDICNVFNRFEALAPAANPFLLVPVGSGWVCPRPLTPRPAGMCPCGSNKRGHSSGTDRSLALRDGRPRALGPNWAQVLRSDSFHANLDSSSEKGSIALAGTSTEVRDLPSLSLRLSPDLSLSGWSEYGNWRASTSRPRRQGPPVAGFAPLASYHVADAAVRCCLGAPMGTATRRHNSADGSHLHQPSDRCRR